MAGSAIASARPADVFAALGSRPRGLGPVEAAARLREAGPNEIQSAPLRPAFLRLLAQLTHFMALLLWAAGALAFVSGMPELGWAIFAVVLLNGAFGFLQEHRAERALSALEALVPRRARVLRDGHVLVIPAREVVRGDVLLLEEGDRVAADARLVASARLRLDLSLLTGESVPEDRDEAPSAPDLPVASVRCFAPAGATVAAGRARAVVFATGAASELGRVASLATAARRAPSTLETQVARIVRIVTAFAVSMGVAVFALLQAFGARTGESVLFAIGIVVANVPEGLLPAITITLASNVQRMARRRAIVSRLSSVETLGAVDVICTDKTGTLTRNELSVRNAWVPGSGVVDLPQRDPGAAVRRLLAAAALANDAQRTPAGLTGDPLDRALVEAAAAAGLEREALDGECPRVAEVPFDARRKRMTVVLRSAPPLGRAPGSSFIAVTKGAFLSVLDRCGSAEEAGTARPLDPAGRAVIVEAHDALARRGQRLIAIAVREAGDDLAELPLDSLEQRLTFLGLLGLEDPPREGVRDALEACRRAGIAVTIVTGDHGLTARAVAEEIGLWSDGWRVVDGHELEALGDAALDALLAGSQGFLFARVTPEQKLRLVRAYQRLGHVVAVTGDGVNDAPALHAAHVGVAMGRGGTDVARAAADIILLDDDFSTIVAAVEEGRATFSNVRKFLAYVFTSNVPEIAPFLAMAALRIPPALGILQILAIDLGTDMLPALALGAERPEPGVMERPPRPPRAPLLDATLVGRAYGFLGVVEAVASLAAFLLVWRSAGYSLSDLQAATPALLAHVPGAAAGIHREATSTALAAVVCCQIGNVFACRSERPRSMRAALAASPFVRWGIAVEIALLLAIVYLPPLQAVFGTAPIPAGSWPWLALCAPALLLLDLARGRAVELWRRRGRTGRRPARGQ
jgi:Ca2+-transporting ATPase